MSPQEAWAIGLVDEVAKQESVVNLAVKRMQKYSIQQNCMA
jgi:enoyl-CoA hydratase/carnithine racemase